MNKNILILVGGNKNQLNPFLIEGGKLGLNICCTSFSELNYFLDSSGKSVSLKIGEYDLKNFDLIYIRLVGRRFEDASIVADYAKKNRIKLVDGIYEKAQFIRLPLAKGLETKLLFEANLPVPKTVFSSLADSKNLGKNLGFPFVIKSTTGKQGHDVWLPKTKRELEELLNELNERESSGERFIFQKFLKAGTRHRILVIGGKAVAGIARPTRWRKRFTKSSPQRSALIPMPIEDVNLAVRASNALGIDIAGVDILVEDKTQKRFVLEVNSAPMWASIKKDTGLNVEAEILKFLMNKLE